MRKILAILPFLVTETTRARHEQILQRDAAPRGTSVTAVGLDHGPTPADYSRPGFQHAVREIVEIAKRYQNRYDGILISCFEDPGLAEVREMAQMPVVGAAHTARRRECSGRRAKIGGRLRPRPRPCRQGDVAGARGRRRAAGRGYVWWGCG